MIKTLLPSVGRTWAVLAAISLLLPACSHLSEKTEATADPLGAGVIRILQEVQRRHAPDPRLGIFRIMPQKQGERILLKGEVDSPDAKKDLIEAFARVGLKTVDRIAVLPDEKLGEKLWGLVSISVANLREDPKPSAELGSQILMGHVIRLWKQEGGWYYAQAADQYLGWVEDDSFVPCRKEQVNDWNSAERVIVTTYEDRVWEQPRTQDTLPVSDVVMGVRLKKTGEEGAWFKVELPDGRTGYLAKSSAEDYAAWQNSRHATTENIARTAQSFLGSPYLWGGTSSKGMDCSGFTQTVFAMHGIPLLRNASQQAHQGIEVPLDAGLSRLQKGDLIFFGFKGDQRRPQKITHVGIYLGGKKFIHASGRVRINSLDPKAADLDERRLAMMLQARRYLTE